MPDASYFAAAPKADIAEKVLERVRRYEANNLQMAYVRLLRECYLAYNTTDITTFGSSSTLSRGGEQGELLSLKTNILRTLVGALANLVTAPKLNWKPKAVNIDYETLQEVKLAAAVLEYEWQAKGVSAYFARAVLDAIHLSEGFILADWDNQQGEIDSPHPDIPGGVIRQGDITYKNVSPWNIIRDPSKPSWDELDSVTVLVPHNKFDLAARYPESIVGILDQGPEDRQLPRETTEENESDDVVVYRFLHKPCAVLPYGRDVRFLSNGTLLSDDILPAAVWPLIRIPPGERSGTPYGYSPFFDAMGLQELYNGINSAIATNQTTFGTQNIAMEEGSATSVDQIAGGLNVFYYPQGGKPPAALQLTASPPESFPYLKDTKSAMTEGFGLNDVVLGKAADPKMSGTALALLQNQAVTQSGILQSNYIRAVEQLGMITLSLYREFATIPRKIALVGRSNSFAVEDAEISKGSFGKVQRVTVEVGNPLSSSPAGRYELAKEMMQMFAGTLSPDQCMQVLETGRLDPITDPVADEAALIASENKDISRGEKPVAMLDDNHLKHGLNHKVTMASPSARRNPKVIAAFTEHMHEHYALFFGQPPGGQGPDGFVVTDPLYRDRMLILSGQTPPPPMMPPGMMGPPPPEGPNGPPPGASGPPSPSDTSLPQPAQPPDVAVDPALGAKQ